MSQHVVTPSPGEPYTYEAVVLYPHDGDTIKCCVDLDQSVRHKDADYGFHVYAENKRLVLHESFRLMGLNAPELATPAGKVALAFVQDWLSNNCVQIDHLGAQLFAVRLTTTPVGPQQEKYGRWLAVVEPTRKGGITSLNTALLNSNNAVPWDGQGPKPVPVPGG